MTEFKIVFLLCLRQVYKEVYVLVM